MTSFFRSARWSIVLLLASVVVKAASPAAPAPWDQFLSTFLEQYFVLHPDAGIAAGRHEFDGQLPDWSEAGQARTRAWLHAERTAAEAYAAADLGAQQSFDRDYLVMEIRRELFWIETIDQPHTNPYFYADAIDPNIYVTRPYASLPVRLQAYVRYVRQVPAAVAQIKRNLDHPVAKSLLNIGRVALGGLADFYQHDVPGVFAGVADPDLQVQFQTANAGAIAAIRGLDAWLAAKAKTADDHFALGAENFRAMVRETEGVDLPVPALEAIARRDLERNLQALREACAAYAPHLSVAAAVAQVMAHKPPGSVTTYAASQLVDLRRFIVAHDLVSIPGTEQAEVKPAPAYRAWNSAYIDIPGPFEKGLPSVYYVSPPDPTWPKAKQEAYIPGIGVLLFTSAHEVYPGHFVQFLHANHAPSRFSQVFVGYAFAEGWAHYCEEMMWEAGLGDHQPEMHIGQLEEALLRDVRFLSAIGLHTQGMTVAESKALFLTQAFQDEGDAEQQANRGTFDPAYLNYTLGKLMIRKLREDWTATRGGRAAWKAFHDRFLQYGGPPIPLVRKAMLGSANPADLF